MSGVMTLSKAEKNALSVSYTVLGSHVELDLQFVKKYLVRGSADYVSDQEVVFFMNTCKSQGLNPLVNGEVYLIKYSKSDPAQMVVGKDAYLRRAFDNPAYLGKEDGITVMRGDEVIQKVGCCLYPGEELIGGWCKVFSMHNGKESITFKEVSLKEYDKGMANWKSKPSTMINKVAVSQCVRDAFPKDYEGLYAEDEMVASGAIPVDFEVLDDAETQVPGEPDEPVDALITNEQRKAMFSAARSKFGEGWKDWIIEESRNHGLTSTNDMPLSVFDKIMAKMIEESQIIDAEIIEDEAAGLAEFLDIAGNDEDYQIDE